MTDDLKFNLIETEKSKEHDQPLTSIDFNRKKNLIVSSCTGGIIKLWTSTKRFIREINFPSKIDSVCFHNAEGDLLISHDKRISLMSFNTYWPVDYYVDETMESDE